MNHQDTISPTLFNLLARQWDTGAPVTSAVFNASQSAAGFALDNGSIVIADVADNDAPGQRIHVSAENGRSTINPRSKGPQPLRIIEVAESKPLLFGTIGETDFVAGPVGGPLNRIAPDGAGSLLDFDGANTVTAIDHCRSSGQFASASGTWITIFDPGAGTPAHRMDQGEPIISLAFAPDGKSIGVAHDHGLTIWSLIDGEHTTRDVNFAGHPTAVHWSRDGRWIASPLATGGFQLSCIDDGRTRALTDYPAPVGSIAWNEPADALITSGAFRIAAWSMQDPPVDDNASGVLETGRAGLVPVTAVSAHPKRNLVVAGYENGLVSIVQIGGRDEMVLNGENHGAVTGLEWSRDGKSIAVGTGRRMAAIVALPPQLFK